MRIAGVLASGETAPANELADAQTALNQMLEAWGTEKLLVFTLARSTPFNFVAGTAAYTLGTGGTFNIPRPSNIEYVTYVYNANPSQPLERQIDMYTDAEWANIPVKNIFSPLPQGVYDDGGFPFRTLTFWPIPKDSSVQAIIGGWQALTQFTDLTTDNTFPPGYIDAIKYNLAVRIAAEWPGNITPLAADLATKSMAKIKGLNVPEIRISIDPILGGGQGGRYDWRSDTYQ
jgi:hypothetical protein